MRKLLAITLLTLCSFAAMAEDAPSTEFTLNTDAFLDTGPLPVLYTCDGKDVSPELDWTNVPAKTKAFAILVADPDAPSGTFYHWVVYNIPASVTTIPQTTNKVPAGISIGKNGFGKLEYNGPCPPKGSVHTYTVDLYALDAKLNLPEGAEGSAVLSEVKKHTVKKIGLTMVYSRWLK